MVRKEQHVKFHILLQLQNDSPETGLQGIYKYICTDFWLWNEKYPIISYSCSSSQTAAEKNLTDFYVMKPVKSKQTGKKKSNTKTPKQSPRNIRMGSTYCFCTRTSESLSEAVKTDRLNRSVVCCGHTKHMNQQIIQHWRPSDHSELIHTLLTHHFAIILLLLSQAALFECSKENQQSIHFYSFYVEKKCVLQWQMKYPWIGLKHLPISLLQKQCLELDI